MTTALEKFLYQGYDFHQERALREARSRWLQRTNQIARYRTIYNSYGKIPVVENIYHWIPEAR